MAGRPAVDDAVNRAVNMVANGCKPRDAWEACGCPNGDKGIQNIRVRGRKRKASQLQPEEPAPSVEPEPEPLNEKKKRKIYANTLGRLRTH